MKIKFRNALYLFLFGLLTALMLLHSSQALELSLNGLNLWFQKMIPTLLPFMILSGILVRMELSDSFARLFSPFLRPVFKLSDSCLYVLVIGFLCGFPMGARVTAESYERGKLSRREASLMLSFCNNIGPIYFTGFVLQLFPVPDPLPFLAGMYLIPLSYGLLLRYSVYRDIDPGKTVNRLPSKSIFGKQKPVRPLSAAQAAAARPGLLPATQESIMSGLCAIASLGGYMILFNLLNIIPEILFSNGLQLPKALIGCVLEITSGLSRLSPVQAFYGFVLLPFGGFSCIAQTYSMIQNTDLSLSEYICHKAIQTGISVLYYVWLFNTLL